MYRNLSSTLQCRCSHDRYHICFGLRFTTHCHWVAYRASTGVRRYLEQMTKIHRLGLSIRTLDRFPNQRSTLQRLKEFALCLCAPFADIPFLRSDAGCLRFWTFSAQKTPAGSNCPATIRWRRLGASVNITPFLGCATVTNAALHNCKRPSHQEPLYGELGFRAACTLGFAGIALNVPSAMAACFSNHMPSDGTERSSTASCVPMEAGVNLPRRATWPNWYRLGSNTCSAVFI
ncbi:hypothetical protein FA95DRAFT_1165575 [Auriscalpium vulgare]|uniref:Uncharacterized protein n=1 Tax=Auriscalpium vulgare TaxID=40419 RepID=A0ACB8S8U8_9AGAM|nr:hypothetical protein FA95DRAFT_1165575 [Auriscalpium vulgare]